MAVMEWREVCRSEDLSDGGEGVRFEVRVGGVPEPAFVIRVGGQVRAYLNRCRHIPVELDWQPGRFLDDSGLYLVCSVHGAMYDALDGQCAGGPCRGRGLAALAVRESGSSVLVEMESEAG
jgi:nitrite reductase/ring-hydroxylating ferredoxin subunit